ncbi:AAA family ATPase [Patescibacteria group bacterium]|nr:AAA family ATPase [Patescibacteria group bacterium]
MPLIDNTSQTMQEALINALSTSDKVDIEVGYFYFSGWQLLAEHLKDKKIRLLVGKYIDPNAVPELLSKMKLEGKDVDLDPFQSRKTIPSRTAKRQTYIDGFVRLSNESKLLDESEDQDAFRILESKIADGSLEIKITANQEHGKMYILHTKSEYCQNGDYPGTVFMGSSNFTFQGLLNQGELNQPFRDKDNYQSYVKKFDSLWTNAENIDIATLEQKDELLDQLKRELWIHSTPSPYAVYVRVLHEIFGKEQGQKIKTPSKITNEKYIDLEYQIDAIKSVIDKINKYDGVILADVVGLGKSIIASAAAHNLGIKPIIIAPPHLRDQWEDYQSEFKLLGARVYSSGTIADVYKKYKNNNEPLLIIIDEAHRYRNEDTDDYRMLHHICNSHAENKIILLTATPFNNDPKDVFALVKLFQIPGQSTIRSVDNLSLRFRELIDRYKKLNRDRRSGKIDQTEIDKEADEISHELRRLIENIVIRRSRLDLKKITRYREDLERQKVDFAEVKGPDLLEYELGDLLDLYLNTLQKITSEEDEDGFIGARYKPAIYIKEREEFMKLYEKEFDGLDLQTAQTNLSKFVKRLLVMRFESSKDAFRSTLENIIASHKLVEDWWHKAKKVPIMKKGKIPDPDSVLLTSDDNIHEEIEAQTNDKEFETLKVTKGLIAVDRELIDPQFIEDVQRDRELLEEIHNNWFGESENENKDFDPKLDEVKEKIENLLQENPAKKIVIFSSYADTVNYLYDQLTKRGLQKVLKYTSADASKERKRILRTNFDAGLIEDEQEDDYDVLIATDALSEGYNLHRAGIVINYDIPYNPTRVIQRIGRINRINKKVFDSLHIFNCFPTDTGESEIRVRQISTLKMRLINAVVGSDTRTLTDDEELQSFFKDEFDKAEEANEIESWDAMHREAYEQAKKDKDVFEEALGIKPRSRVIRTEQKKNVIVAFGKKGEHAVFALKEELEPAIVAAELALHHFIASKEEDGQEVDKQYDEVFKVVRDALFEKHPLPTIRGRRLDALTVVKMIEEKLPKSKDYCRDLAQIIKKYDGISEGDLKKIAKLKLKDLRQAYDELKEIVPEHHITAINERVARLEGEYETIVLSEELRI